MAPAANLLVGARAIATYVYGTAGPKQTRDIYRNVLEFSFFKHGNAIAALKSTIDAELAEKQRAAIDARQAKKHAPVPSVVKSQRGRSRQQQPDKAEKLSASASSPRGIQGGP